MMSDEDRQLLDKVRPHLMSRITLKGSDLLAQLRSKGAITEMQEGTLKAAGAEHSQTEQLLDVLRKGDEHTLDRFYESLVASGQEAVAKTYLRPPAGQAPSAGQAPAAQGGAAMNPAGGDNLTGLTMSAHHKGQLEHHRADLVESIEPGKGLINELRGDVLTVREGKDILRAAGEEAQNEALLDCLLRKPDDAFEKFLKALEKTGQKAMATMLRN